MEHFARTLCKVLATVIFTDDGCQKRSDDNHGM
jgi:hypothetical protein